MKSRQRLGPRFIAVNLDIVTDGFRRPECENAARGEKFLGANLLQQLLRVIEKLARLFAHDRIVEDRRIASTQFPGMEERRPVDVSDEIVESDCLFPQIRRINARS